MLINEQTVFVGYGGESASMLPNLSRLRRSSLTDGAVPNVFDLEKLLDAITDDEHVKMFTSISPGDYKGLYVSTPLWLLVKENAPTKTYYPRKFILTEKAVNDELEKNGDNKLTYFSENPDMNIKEDKIHLMRSGDFDVGHPLIICRWISLPLIGMTDKEVVPLHQSSMLKGHYMAIMTIHRFSDGYSQRICGSILYRDDEKEPKKHSEAVASLLMDCPYLELKEMQAEAFMAQAKSSFDNALRETNV